MCPDALVVEIDFVDVMPSMSRSISSMSLSSVVQVEVDGSDVIGDWGHVPCQQHLVKMRSFFTSGYM
jgi:hypothetical protein